MDPERKKQLLMLILPSTTDIGNFAVNDLLHEDSHLLTAKRMLTSLLDNDTDTDEDEPSSKRSKMSMIESSQYWEKEVPQFSDSKFKSIFRVSRNTFNVLKNNLNHLQRQDTHLRQSIPLEKRIAITLYYTGCSAEYKTIGNLFGVGRTTVGGIVLEVCKEIWTVFHKQYMNAYPPTIGKLHEIVNGFNEMYGIPQCYGVVDVCHIEIRPQHKTSLEYYNSKEWHSVILLAATDHKYKFTFIGIGTPGSVNHSTVFDHSALKKLHEINEIFMQNRKIINGIEIPIILIGNNAFKLSPYVLKPFPNKQERKEKLFNQRLSNCNKIMKNTIRQMKARFPRIAKGLDVHLSNVNSIVKACCLLHNICKEENDDMFDSWLDECNTFSRRIQPMKKIKAGENDALAVQIRQTICDYLNDLNSGVDSDAEDKTDYDGNSSEADISSNDDCDGNSSSNKVSGKSTTTT